AISRLPADISLTRITAMTASTAKFDPAQIDCSHYAKGLFIDGKWLPGSGIKVVNPSDESVLAEVANASIDDAMAAVDAADKAAKGWRNTPTRQRAEILRRCFELITERAEELATLISLENGKALSDARGEVAYAAE